MSRCFLMKLKNWVTNCSLSFADSASISCLPCFLYIWLSSANPSFHDAITEIARVWPRCSSVLRATLSWSFWHYGLNLLVFSLVMGSLTFSITLVISEFEVTNCLLSSIRDRPQIQFLMHNVQPSRRSGIPGSQSSCSFFIQSGIAALYPPGLSLCLNLFFRINSFILLLSVMASGVVCRCWKVFHSFGVMNPIWFNGETPAWT
jgi:hypothetical protein